MIFGKNTLFVISISFCSISSCVLPLDSIKNFDEIKKIEHTELSCFNGNYRIESTDSSKMLAYVFLYNDLFDRTNMPTIYDYINITAVKNKKLRIKLFVNNELIKTKVISGVFDNSSFLFKNSHVDFFYGIIAFRNQTNRLSLSAQNDLFLDTNYGGIATFLLMPIPLSGASQYQYGVKFKRIR